MNLLSRFSLRTTLPLGLLAFWLALLGLSISASLWQHTHQVLQQANEDLMTETAHLMRMAERGRSALRIWLKPMSLTPAPTRVSPWLPCWMPMR
jgi:hypothetical protein